MVCVYSMTEAVKTMVDSIMVVGVSTHYAMLHSICNLRAAQQHILIWELGLYKFKLGHNAMEETKNSYCVKDESDHSTVTK